MSDFAKAPIVILSSVEWDAAWQRHQVFASQWAAAGRAVFFVENTGFRNPTLWDLPRLWRKILRLMGGGRRAGHAEAPRNLRVINPLVLPPTFGLFRRINAFLLAPRLVEQLRGLGLKGRPIVVAYPPTATTLTLLDLLEPALTVYDCVDNFRGLPAPPADLDAMERSLMARSALVLTTSRTLYEDKAPLHPNVAELHHGVSPDFFIAERSGDEHRKLCYFGTLWRAVDYEPVRTLAEAGFSVDLIGPQKETPPSLPRGVTLRPPIPHSRLPEALAGYDALLLPYADDEYNRGVIPAKIYECLATGRPVIASPLPALAPLGEALYIAKTPRDWVDIVRGLARTETADRRRARIALARENSSSRTFSIMTGLLERSWNGGPSSHRAPAVSSSPLPGGHLLAILRGFTWIGFLYGLAKTSTLLTQVLAGRWLGPLEFGKANLAIAAAAYLQILPMMGFPLAMSKFLPDASDDAERRRIISTTLAAFAVWAGLWLIVLAAGHGDIARRLSISDPLLTVSVGFAYFTAFYVVVSSPLLGLRRFDHRGISEALYGLSAPLILLVFVLRDSRSYEALIATLCLSLAAGSLYSLWALRGMLRAVFDARAFRLVFRYAAVATLNLLAVACVLGPARLILHHYETAHEVGIFSAYFTSTAQVSLAILYMLSAVLVPLASGPEGQAETWKTFRRIAGVLGLGAWAFFLVTTVLALALFGRNYPFHAGWAALFSAAAALMLVHGIASALYSARDFEGLCVSVAGGLVAGLGNVGLGLVLIPSWGITGAAASLVGAYVLGLACYGAYSLKKA